MRDCTPTLNLLSSKQANETRETHVANSLDLILNTRALQNPLKHVHLFHNSCYWHCSLSYTSG